MRKVKFRSKEEKLELVAKFKELVAGGMAKQRAANELGLPYGSLMHWVKTLGGGDGDFPIVSVSPKATRTYVKKEKASGKAIVIVTDISSLSSVLSSL